jgi:hypothetical protein
MMLRNTLRQYFTKHYFDLQAVKSLRSHVIYLARNTDNKTNFGLQATKLQQITLWRNCYFVNKDRILC